MGGVHEDPITRVVLERLRAEGYTTRENLKVAIDHGDRKRGRLLDGFAWRGPSEPNGHPAWSQLDEAIVVEVKQHLTAPLLGQAVGGALLVRMKTGLADVGSIAASAVDCTRLREAWEDSAGTHPVGFEHYPHLRSGGSNYRGEEPQADIEGWLIRRGWSAEVEPIGDHPKYDGVVVGRRSGQTVIFTGQKNLALGRSCIGRVLCARAALSISDAVVIINGEAAADMAALARDLEIGVVQEADLRVVDEEPAGFIRVMEGGDDG